MKKVHEVWTYRKDKFECIYKGSKKECNQYVKENKDRYTMLWILNSARIR